MVNATITVSDTAKQSVRRSAVLLRAQAQYLNETESEITLPAVQRYIATMDKLAAAPGPVEVTPEDANALQQTRVLLEGVRNGFANADFTDRANKVNADAVQIGELVKSANEQLAEEP